MRSHNMVYKRLLNSDIDYAYTEVATYSGIAKKTLIFLLATVIGAFGGFALARFSPEFYTGILSVSGILTFIFALVAMFSPAKSKTFGILYCLFEGVLVGFVSLVYGTLVNGSIVAALVGTLSVFAVVAVLFTTNIVKVTSRFKKFLVMFSISFIVSQLILFIVMRIAGQEYGSGLLLLVSGITVFLASLYLLLDLENIRLIVEGQYPKEMEWYASFGLAFTLIWIYVEILRFIAVFYSDR